MTSGYKDLMTSTKLKYRDGRKDKPTSYSDPYYVNIYIKGPQITPEFTHKIVYLNDSLEFESSEDQEIYNVDELTIKLSVKATNYGNDRAS